MDSSRPLIPTYQAPVSAREDYSRPLRSISFEDPGRFGRIDATELGLEAGYGISRACF
jgi:hypothetical protein